MIGWPPLERWGWPPAWRVSGFYRAFNEASMGLHGRGAGCEGRPAGCRMGVQGGLLHASTWARTTTRRRRETTQLFTSSGHALVALDHHSWTINGGRDGIGRLRRPVSGSNCVLHPTGMLQAACGGLAEGVGLVALGDLSPARTAFSSHRNISSRLRRIGGRGGIRTHGWFNPTLDFESSALNRTQPPFQMTWNYSSSAVA